ncbi:P-loop containing nucleoside triphosphate hydrolase protein [Lophiostoma macrostomum CBS 122681]|uniref:P-loop containing nucleoside triphosphate hydrolase protein n=1 Tax=Lophiostoma macrostomum CBS 122681 TaxID=1314788 RepID=A0A6A6THH4_9PLEO|nr:P-loop containing nucleoside triphosphate hydrolase protein [Lophiostoma macrostomum CBS 122681]
MSTVAAQPVLLVGISGPSSSGKTTLARLLRDTFPSTFILHLDDFYLTDADIPIKDGFQDWDCVESLNLSDLRSALSYIKAHGKSPPNLVSQEDQNSVGEHGVSQETIQNLRKEVEQLTKDYAWKTPICIVDGFLLFAESMPDIREMFDVRLFLRTTYETAKRRREARSGYVTLEGFWQDPPGYVDKIVWPNYVKDHRFLYEKRDVHQNLDEDICDRLRIHGMPKEGEEDMTKCLQWAIEVLEKEIQANRT